MDYDTGGRVAFGRDGAPPARLDEAVTASCAIPGWYAPVLIDGRRYVDGGTLSATSADLLAAEPLDEVYVLAPMASFVSDHPRPVAARLERRLRRQVTRRLIREAQSVEPGRRRGDRARARARGPRRDRRQPDGPAAAGSRCSRPRCAPAGRRWPSRGRTTSGCSL